MSPGGSSMGTPRDVLSECPRFYVPPGVVLRKLGSVKTAHKYLGLPPLSNISALKKMAVNFGVATVPLHYLHSCSQWNIETGTHRDRDRDTETRTDRDRDT